MDEVLKKIVNMQMDDAMDVLFVHGLTHKIEGMNGKSFNIQDAGQVANRVLLTVRWHRVETARLG